jgi:hypothetical protein
MSDLSTLLKDASAEARNYADGSLAVARTQRARRIRVAIAAVLVAGLFAGGAALWQQREPQDPVGPPLRSHPLYPPVVAPSGQAPLLPDKAIGVATFLYSPCADRDTCPEYLVVPDGTQYRLPHAAGAGHSLSPDGRYLGWSDENRYHIRDLRGSAVVDVDVPGPGRMIAAQGWSPDSHYVVAVRFDNDEPRTYVRAVTDGSEPAVTIPHDDTPTPDRDEFIGVLDSGFIVARPGLQYPQPEYLRVLDAVSGKESRRISLDRAGISAAAGVTPGGVEIVIAPCGCEVDFLLGRPIAEFGANTGLPQIDHAILPVSPVLSLGVIRADATGSGRVLGRVDLPPPVLDRRHARFTSAWSIRTDSPEGFIAVNWRLDGTDIALVDRVTGARNVVTRLPAGAVPLMRGNVYPG